MQSGHLASVQAALAHMEMFVRNAILVTQANGHNPSDVLRGLVISTDDVLEYLTQTPLPSWWSLEIPRPELLTIDRIPPTSTLRLLVERFNLTTLDLNILLLAAAPAFDQRYERLYAFLQDDVTRKHLTVNLAMNLLGSTLEDRQAVWGRLSRHNPLNQHHLVIMTPETAQCDTNFLTLHLAVDRRLVDFLCGDIYTPDERLKNAVAELQVDEMFQPARQMVSLLEKSDPVTWLVYVYGPRGIGRHETVASLCEHFGFHAITVELRTLSLLDIGLEPAWSMSVREASLTNSCLVILEWTAGLKDDGEPYPFIWESILNYAGPVFICGEEVWEPHDSLRSRHLLRFPMQLPDFAGRRYWWEQRITECGLHARPGHLDQLASTFYFTPARIAHAVHSAIDFAASRGDTATIKDLFEAGRSHSTLNMGRIAKHITPCHDWDDLILPSEQIQQLRELRLRSEYTHLVRDVWGYGRKVAPRPGVNALFAGESGTGKTMAAEVIARDLGLALYRIELSLIVSKYIGETEKNLRTVFREAENSSAILFFDEADALFGKRSEVKDAHDRYANIEVAYLLQQIEDYHGIAILATNLRQNLDEAFTRRLDFVIDFPFPEAEYRRRIWENHFPPEVPLGIDINFDELAERFPMAGGNIRNVAVASAFLAAADGRMITSQHIYHAIRREHQKMGRLLTDEQ